ncbi:hypothetical protein BGZ58_002128 [Dissophora ornata]|nr:hypothetical protein BGZ58_002128 [Dissophora ornata]
MSPPGSTPSSPVASPKMTVFSSAAAVSASGYAVPPSPRTLFYRGDSAPPLKRTESNASSNSISTINSTSGDVNGLSETADENGLTTSPLDFDLKRNKSSNNPGVQGSIGSDIISSSNKPLIKKTTIISGKKYCTDNDLHPIQIAEKEEKAAAAASAKKTKKLWSVYGSSSQPPSSDKASNGSGSKKTTSDSLDPKNPMYKGLVLISAPSKKSSSRSSSSTKGLSKSMSSLSKGSELDTPLTSATRLLVHDNAHFPSRTRSPSVSVLDEAPQSAIHEHSQKLSVIHTPTVGDILSSRTATLTKSHGASAASQQDVFALSFNHRTTQKHPSASQGQKYVTAPISLSTGNWAQGQQQLQRCVGPELEGHASQVSKQTITQNVSRHIVAPDELTMAINQEVEERRQKQEQERLEKSLEASKRPTSIMGPASSAITRRANSNSNSKDVGASHSRNILAIIESGSVTHSAPPVDGTAAVAVSTIGGAFIRSEEISKSSLPPPKRHHSTFSNVASAQTQAQQARGGNDTSSRASPTALTIAAASPTVVDIASDITSIDATSPIISSTKKPDSDFLASPVVKRHSTATKADSKVVAVQVQGDEVSTSPLESASTETEEAHEILLSAIDATASSARVSDSADAPNGHQPEEMAVVAPRGSHPPVSVIIGEASRSVYNTPSWTPTTPSSSASLSASPASPVPPALPRRSPFRSAPIPYVLPNIVPLP